MITGKETCFSFGHFDLFLNMCQSVDRLTRYNFLNCSIFSLAFIASYKGSLTRINYPKLNSLVHLLSYEYFL